MTATGRSEARIPNDFYGTPSYTVHRLLERLDLPGGAWLEPSAGAGNIIRAVNAVRRDVKWTAVEHGEATRDALLDTGATVFSSTNFLGWAPLRRFSVCLMNPPFKNALAHVQHAMTMADVVVALLRMNWLCSEDRHAWMSANTPDLYVLPQRPSFTGVGVDSTEYAWMVWGRGGRRLEMLALTDLSQRNADREELIARGQMQFAVCQ